MILYKVEDLYFLLQATSCAAFTDMKSSTINMWMHGHNVIDMTGWTKEYDKEWRKPIEIVQEHWERLTDEPFPQDVEIVGRK